MLGNKKVLLSNKLNIMLVHRHKRVLQSKYEHKNLVEKNNNKQIEKWKKNSTNKNMQKDYPLGIIISQQCR